MKFKTNKIFTKRPRTKLKIKKIRIEVEVLITKRITLVFLSVSMIFKGVGEKKGVRTINDKLSHHCRHVHASLERKHYKDYTTEWKILAVERCHTCS